MKQSKTLQQLAVLAVLGAPLTAAMATNGYFAHGYGLKAKGMGGAAIALTENAFAGANNPATAAFAGNRFEIGADWFAPDRGMSRTGSGAGLNANVTSDSKNFLIPELGYNRAVNDRLAMGVTVYGNGGMNTDYPGGQLNCGGGPGTSNVLCGGGRLGVDLIQLVVAPTLAYKVSPQHSLGVSPLLVYQRFEAKGLQAFQGFSSAPTKLTNNGTDSSTGVGVRLGYLGRLNSQVSVGASYAPKIKMSKFDKYAGLFANAGSFDIPENYGLGASFQATPSLMFALDYQRINYSGVASVGNPSTNQAPLGGAGGPGFGWASMSVWKLGGQWQASPQLALRAGYNKGENPIQARDITFNILAPGVSVHHFTLGGTYALSPRSELTLAFMHAPKQSVSGSSLFNGLMGPGAGGTESIRMSQKSLGVQFGMRF